MSEVRSDLFRLQQIVMPQREMLGRGGDLLETLPGLERDVARHPFRDVHDQPRGDRQRDRLPASCCPRRSTC
jgi:hypothetical protein